VKMTTAPAKFAQVECDLRLMDTNIHAALCAIEASERFTAEARRLVESIKNRRQRVADDVAILKEMLGVR
jgi:hypothetical protein